MPADPTPTAVPAVDKADAQRLVCQVVLWQNTQLTSSPSIAASEGELAAFQGALLHV